MDIHNGNNQIPEDVIAGWYGKKPDHGFDDVLGLEILKDYLRWDVENLAEEKLRSAALSLNLPKSYLFYGPPGSGKTYLAEAFARELMEKGFRYIRLSAGDIQSSFEGVAEETVQTAFREAIANAPCVIYIDELEGVCSDRDGPNAEVNERWRTVAFLEAWVWLRNSKKKMVFIGATNCPELVDEALLEKVQLYGLPLPGEAEREAFFERSLAGISLSEGLTYADMVGATDNCNYRELLRLTDACREALGGSGALSRELFFRIARENPPRDKTVVRQRLEAFEARRRGEMI